MIPQRVPASITDPVVGVLARAGVTPNMLTFAGFCGNVVAAVFVAKGHFVTGGILMLAFSLLDAFDGALARSTGRATPFGSVFDATLDRMSESVVLFALAFYFSGQDDRVTTLAILAAVIGSLLVSYVRARVEITGERLMEGFFTRAVRVAVLAIALVLYGVVGIRSVQVAVWVLAVMANLTAVHRLVLAWLKLRGRES
jgi:CDP-diacylglycerol--glycerol-3-phosphate 3-phosphatidyltransferase